MRKFLFKPRFNRFDCYFINPICIVLGYLAFKENGIMAIGIFLFAVLVIGLLCAVSAYEENKVK
jgi:hypothetical protein